MRVAASKLGQQLVQTAQESTSDAAKQPHQVHIVIEPALQDALATQSTSPTATTSTTASTTPTSALAATLCVQGLSVGSFVFNQYQGAAQKPGKTKHQPLKASLEGGWPAVAKQAAHVGAAQNTARTLAATPPNLANPKTIAAFCKKAAQQQDGLSCKVINASQAKQLGLGGLFAVGQAGSTPPCLIQLTYTPTNQTAKTKKPILIVGKAITFDTGGYSLKPDGGVGMKYDKCGGMNTIGALLAAAAIKPKVPVIGLVACAENMIDSTAYRPDDIIRFYNGVTCEITNTDAEGRLVLADALAYGTQTYKPQAVLDMATLTGGVGIALGSYAAGMWCHDFTLKTKIQNAATQSGERVWELPLWDEHRKLMRSKHADLVNSAPVRECHATQGAAFLSHFVGQDAPQQMPTTPWVHLDIAYSAVQQGGDAQPMYPKGPTGYGVQLIAALLNHWQD